MNACLLLHAGPLTSGQFVPWMAFKVNAGNGLTSKLVTGGHDEPLLSLRSGGIPQVRNPRSIAGVRYKGSIVRDPSDLSAIKGIEIIGRSETASLGTWGLRVVLIPEVTTESGFSFRQIEAMTNKPFFFNSGFYTARFYAAPGLGINTLNLQLREAVGGGSPTVRHYDVANRLMLGLKLGVDLAEGPRVYNLYLAANSSLGIVQTSAKDRVSDRYIGFESAWDLISLTLKNKIALLGAVEYRVLNATHDTDELDQLKAVGIRLGTLALGAGVTF